MELTILYLYFDCMNLYGENGNVRMLQRRLEEQGASVNVLYKTIGDELDFSSCDFVYCGAGMESRRNMALTHLYRYKNELKAALADGLPALFTGNSWEMLGNSIQTGNGKILDGLGVFDFDVVESDTKRTTGDAIMKSDIFSEAFVGFINKCSIVKGVKSPLFTVQMGSGNSPDDKVEGIVSDHFFGTGLIGPVLVRNPHFLRYLLKLMLKEKYRETAYPFENVVKFNEENLKEE